MKAAKKEAIRRPNIFECADHISFLKDWLEYLKRTEIGFSMRLLAKNSSLAIGYLPMCFSGKRTLSTKALHRLLPNLHLYSQEEKYLELLHTVGTSTESFVRLRAIKEMSKLPAFREKNQKDLDTYRYLTRWHYLAIREMVGLDDFEADPKWIQQRLNGKISIDECRDALQFLESRGFIQKNSQGKYSIPDVNLECKEGIYKASLSEFHRQIFLLAAESIEKVPRESRYILGHTLPVNLQDMKEAREILDEALKKLEALARKTKVRNEVFHVEMAFFPLTKSDKMKGEGS